MGPLISILINNYNYGRFLEDALNSALGQTYQNIEVIVVDDGSTDNSRDILKPYEERATIIYKENGGQASAFNAGFEHSKGDIICFLDSDDAFLPHKIEKVVDSFVHHPAIKWCFDSVTHTDEHLKPIGNRVVTDKIYEADYRSNMAEGSLTKHLAVPFPPTSGLSFKRELLEPLFPMPVSESCSMCENYLRYVAVGTSTGVFLDSDLTLQRIHGKNLFTGKNKDASMSARISILTGYWLYKHFPQFGNFADTQMALGISLMDTHAPLDPKYHEYVHEYRRSRGLLHSAKINMRSLFYRIRRSSRAR
jgi:glycosyltransferase involved in cell wall biosynthesis